jgi:hypothetical protein
MLVMDLVTKTKRFGIIVFSDMLLLDLKNTGYCLTRTNLLTNEM